MEDSSARGLRLKEKKKERSYFPPHIIAQSARKKGKEEKKNEN
jgi:hypothetical protein